MITGAAQGIGKAIAEAFVAEGAELLLADIDADRLAATAAELGQEGLALDVAHKVEIERLFARVAERWGGLDLLVNNAGVTHAADLDALTEEDFDRVFAINLKSALWATQAAARLMGPGSAVVNLSSVNAVLAIPNQIPYVLSKGAMKQLTNVTALALAPKGIRVNAIGPGSIMTDTREYGTDSLGRAIAEAQHAMAIDPNYSLAQAVYATTVSGAYFAISLPDPARESEIQHHIDRAFGLDPDNAGVLAAIAAASAYIGRPTEGLIRAQRAIRLWPEHGHAHYAAGVNALLLGQEADAIAHLGDFARVEPDSHLHYVVHAWRGVAYMRTGDFAAARSAFAAGLALFPRNVFVLLILACLEQIEGDKDTASQRLCLALEFDAKGSADLYHTRIARFFAGSGLLDQMHRAFDDVWLTVNR